MVVLILVARGVDPPLRQSEDVGVGGEPLGWLLAAGLGPCGVPVLRIGGAVRARVVVRRAEQTAIIGSAYLRQPSGGAWSPGSAAYARYSSKIARMTGSCSSRTSCHATSARAGSPIATNRRSRLFSAIARFGANAGFCAANPR